MPARILRLPGDPQPQARPAPPVRLLAYRSAQALYSFASALGELCPSSRTARDRPRVSRRRRARRVASRQPNCSRSRRRMYVHRLAGRAPNREGKIRCPFHDDHDSEPAALCGRRVLLLRPGLPPGRDDLRFRLAPVGDHPEGCRVPGTPYEAGGGVRSRRSATVSRRDATFAAPVRGGRRDCGAAERAPSPTDFRTRRVRFGR